MHQRCRCRPGGSSALTASRDASSSSTTSYHNERTERATERSARTTCWVDPRTTCMAAGLEAPLEPSTAPLPIPN